MKTGPATSGTTPDERGTGRHPSNELQSEQRDAQGGTTRRSFLFSAAAGAVALAWGRRADALDDDSALAGSSAQAIGLGLYTVRDMMAKNFDYTLQQVAAVGYKEVEFAGLYDKEPRRVRSLLDKLKLTSPSSHIPYDRLRNNLQGVAEEARVLGNRYVVCPWLAADVRRDAADYKKVAADCNRFAESLKRVGIAFGYHNHDFEFAKLPGGEIGYDILLADCDPTLVKMELDLYWITKAGADPLAYFAKWPGRFPLVHVKDMAGNGSITNVGQGTIDWGRIFAKRREAGIEHFYVERDNPTSVIEDIKVSYTYMARLGL